jgi:hypothetical protein
VRRGHQLCLADQSCHRRACAMTCAATRAVGHRGKPWPQWFQAADAFPKVLFKFAILGGKNSNDRSGGGCDAPRRVAPRNALR